jgi:nitrogen fixation protein NifU and related proteins
MKVDFYREAILDHYSQPRHWAVLQNPNIDHEEKNPLCGDRLRLTMRVQDGKIAELGWSGEGCAISQAVNAWRNPCWQNARRSTGHQ